MLIKELTREECLGLLARAHLGRIACAQGNQPYIVPFYFALDDNCLYSFATVGQRIQWMRANPLVCVQADDIAGPDQWLSVVVFGRYQELPDTPEFQQARVIAYNRLHTRANWWEPGYVETVLQGVERPLEPVYFRVKIAQVTGHCASPGAQPPASR
jgi:nitroimidazol reductase NimA-like FMN-containing flavoprotein (pyridoxamine 5'-phosphate oxidase superfamily)